MVSIQKATDGYQINCDNLELIRHPNTIEYSCIFTYFSDWEKNGTGCVFDHFGKVPESVYQPNTNLHELEQAVKNNDLATFNQLVKVSREFV